MRRDHRTERNKQIIQLRELGWDMKSLAEKFKLTRQRIDQIIKGKYWYIKKTPTCIYKCFLCEVSFLSFKKRPRSFCDECIKKPYVGKSGRDLTRMKVRIRDKFTCTDCKQVRTPEMAKMAGDRLYDVHHLNGLCGKKSRGYDRVSDIDGLITLCHRCHFNRPEHRMKMKTNCV